MKTEREAVEIIAFVPGYRINGVVHLPPGGRITDFVNVKEKPFIAVTKASIYFEETGKLAYKSEFVDLNRDYIMLIFPTAGAKASVAQSETPSSYKV
jgi:hypothetical protein